jgi:hypothetical protein
MWKQPPDRDVVDNWIDRALELAEEGSPTHARALAAAALWRKDESAARRLHAIAQERRASLECARSADGRRVERGRPRAGAHVAGGTARASPELLDPDDRHFALMTAVSLYLSVGRLAEAVRASELLDQMVEGLTPHHRLHGVANRIHVEAIRGRWERIRELTLEAERRVEANSAAPCPANAGCLFNCALASVHCRDEHEAARLEAEAESQIRDAYRSGYSAAKLRLALARKDVHEVERLVGSHDPGSLAWLEGPAALLDGLVALGALDRIEAEATEFLGTGTYAEPFALRALGVARGDAKLLEHASSRFRAIGLDWRADETERMRAKGGTG